MLKRKTYLQSFLHRWYLRCSSTTCSSTRSSLWRPSSSPRRRSRPCTTSSGSSASTTSSSRKLVNWNSFFFNFELEEMRGVNPPYWRGEGMCDPFLIRIYTPTHKLSFTLEFRRWGEGGGGVVTPFLATMFSFNWLPFQVPLCVLQDLGDRVPSQAGAVPGITFIYQTLIKKKYTTLFLILYRRQVVEEATECTLD